MEYEWTGYDITGEIVCGGIISAQNSRCRDDDDMPLGGGRKAEIE